jgi:dTDP-4-dehydrorhamnose 3,5-epimerase
VKATTTPIPGLLILEPRVFRDDRGFFLERYREDKLAELGIREKFVQDNHSRSSPRVLRGLHFQTNPAQGKLVSCIRGRIWDVAVDLRKGSATYGRHFGLELNDVNCQSLWIPYGFAHGFCVLGDSEADVYYQVTGVYNAQTEGGIRWDSAGVEWPVKDPLVSARDVALPTMQEAGAL